MTRRDETTGEGGTERDQKRGFTRIKVGNRGRKKCDREEKRRSVQSAGVRDDLVASHHNTSCWKFLGSKADDGPGSVSFASVSQVASRNATTPHASRSETDCEVSYKGYRRKFTRESSGLDTRGSVDDSSNVKKTPRPFARGLDKKRGLHVVIQ